MNAVAGTSHWSIAPTLLPLKHKALASLRLSQKEIASAASRVWTVAPALKTRTPPAIYLDSDMSLVTDTGAYGTVREAFQDLQKDEWEHGATMAYQLDRASIVDGRVYCGRWKGHWMPGRVKDLFGPMTVLDHASLACTWMGNLYFGHWLLDDVPLHLAAETTGDPFVTKRAPYTQEAEYMRLFDISSKSLERAHIRELILHEDGGQNTFKSARYHQLRDRVSAQVGRGAGKPVYLIRGSGGAQRALVNEPEITAYLQSQGFEIACPETTPLADLMKILSGAPLVVGIEGSHMTHAIYAMAAGGTLCTLQPPDRFVNVVRGFVSCIGSRYATVVGQSVPDGFLLPLQKLKQILEKINP